MKSLRIVLLSALCAQLAFGFPGGFLSGDEDPVMKARAQRAAAQGISEADLPPVPKGIVEPPPLPSPEIHPRDTRGYKAARRNRRGRTGKATVKRGKGAPKAHKASPKKRRH